MGSKVRIVTATEVAVVRRDNRVLFTFLHVVTVPLTNARTTSVGEHHTTNLVKDFHLTITLNSGTDLL